MLYNEARPATKTTAININYVNDIIRVLSFECFVVTWYFGLLQTAVFFHMVIKTIKYSMIWIRNKNHFSKAIGKWQVWKAKTFCQNYPLTWKETEKSIVKPLTQFFLLYTIFSTKITLLWTFLWTFTNKRNDTNQLESPLPHQRFCRS